MSTLPLKNDMNDDCDLFIGPYTIWNGHNFAIWRKRTHISVKQTHLEMWSRKYRLLCLVLFMLKSNLDHSHYCPWHTIQGLSCIRTWCSQASIFIQLITDLHVLTISDISNTYLTQLKHACLITPPVCLLFGAVFWFRQPRVFLRLTLLSLQLENLHLLQSDL